MELGDGSWRVLRVQFTDLSTKSVFRGVADDAIGQFGASLPSLYNQQCGGINVSASNDWACNVPVRLSVQRYCPISKVASRQWQSYQEAACQPRLYAV
jgi:hypothetical protein